MCFIAVVLQEVVTGKGVIQGISEGDAFSVACLVVTLVVIGALTAFLAIKGADNYVDEDLGRK
jgi:SNF family Na+-dependent transporter